ncbi:MAG: SDR family oxidoreductase [Myxococcales bacterium]
MLLKGKTALITGCLKGIGRSAMELFAKEGCNVWACGQHEDPAFEEATRVLAQESGVMVTPLYFDLTDPEQIKAAMKRVVSAKQRVDILLNVAGLTRDSLFHMTTMESMKSVFEVNFFSQMLITQYVTKLMVRQKSGSVIFVSSVTAMDGNVGQVSYSASKAALIGATKTLAAEMAEHNIRVNAVAPGVIKTDMTAVIPPDAFQSLCARIPMGRVGLPSEVGGAMLFLASDLSSYVTGQVVRIDGGMG